MSICHRSAGKGFHAQLHNTINTRAYKKTAIEAIH